MFVQGYVLDQMVCIGSFTCKLSFIQLYHVENFLSRKTTCIILFSSKNFIKKQCVIIRGGFMHISRVHFRPAPFWQLIFRSGTDIAVFDVIWYKFALNLALIQLIFFLNYAETAPSNGSIWEFSEQHQHLRIKSTMFNARLAL